MKTLTTTEERSLLWNKPYGNLLFFVVLLSIQSFVCSNTWLRFIFLITVKLVWRRLGDTNTSKLRSSRKGHNKLNIAPKKNISIEPGSATTLEGKARQDFKLAFTKTKGNRDSGEKIANVSLKHFRRVIEETSRL